MAGEVISQFMDLGKGVGLAGLVVAAVVSIFRGLLVPRKTVEKLLDDRDLTIRHLWEASNFKDKTIQTLSEQVRDLRETGRLSVATLQSIQEIAVGPEERS